jgi:hypothetical protein
MPLSLQPRTEVYINSGCLSTPTMQKHHHVKDGTSMIIKDHQKTPESVLPHFNLMLVLG